MARDCPTCCPAPPSRHDSPPVAAVPRCLPTRKTWERRSEGTRPRGAARVQRPIVTRRVLHRKAARLFRNIETKVRGDKFEGDPIVLSSSNRFQEANSPTALAQVFLFFFLLLLLLLWLRMSLQWPLRNSGGHRRNARETLHESTFCSRDT